jgi:hypothetical protein
MARLPPRGVCDIGMEPLPSPWGRLAVCAAVAYRRRLAPKCQWADCQSAAACQAAPHNGALCLAMRSASGRFASQSHRRPFLCRPLGRASRLPDITLPSGGSDRSFALNKISECGIRLLPPPRLSSRSQNGNLGCRSSRFIPVYSMSYKRKRNLRLPFAVRTPALRAAGLNHVDRRLRRFRSMPLFDADRSRDGISR